MGFPKQAELDGRLLFACPKKGRIFDQSVRLLKKIGITYHRGHRSDIALATDKNIAIVFLPASDIALYVAQGRVDIGITGQDIIAEKQVQVDELLQLGYGKCRLCVQAPVRLMDDGTIKDPKDLCGKRIVTSFPHLAGEFFKQLCPEKETKINVVSGSVEAACALGLADAIVDLVETGDTMRAAGLDVVADVMATEAVLIGNPNSAHKDLIKTITTRCQGVANADRYVLIEYNIPRDKLAAATQITRGKQSPTIQALENPDWVAVKTLEKKGNINEIMDTLLTLGAQDILVYELLNTRV
eukprot:comp18542_c0_seq1/m.19986 comp18542_c0_seq1/g.19986  ORF comp18542_c0_seq1/g.19986 comp18542_c0_seq1/m.19986 type:complete len:299 (-) comp18542_c0_seq1:603-1499(-)